MMRVPVGPPATPVAITGWPSFFRARATLTPLPPAIERCSTERWRRPSRKFGTANVRSIAALSVTVMIILDGLLALLLSPGVARFAPAAPPVRPAPQARGRLAPRRLRRHLT